MRHHHAQVGADGHERAIDVGEDEFADQDAAVSRGHGRGDGLEDFSCGLVGPVVDDEVEVVDQCT